MKNPLDLFVTYKRLRDFVENSEHKDYINLKLINKQFPSILSDLAKKNIDHHKYFYANLCLRDDFHVHQMKYDKSFRIYQQFDEWIEKNHKKFLRIILKNIKYLPKFDTNDRDKFLELLPKMNWRVWSSLYPEVKELINSIEDEWVEIHMPKNKTAKYLIRKITKGYMLLQKMPGFQKLRKKVKEKIL